jgi:outer membrane protein assembly factor BamD
LKYRILTLITFLFIIALSAGCTHTIILLSPEDHYTLGNYFLEKSKNARAKEQFEYIRDNYPSSAFSTMSQFKLAQTQFSRKNYEEAAIDFELFLEFHPAHKLAPYAQYHLALSKLESSASSDRDTTMASEALIAFNTFLNRYPDHPNHETAVNQRNQVEDLLLEHELEVAKVYFRRKAFFAAIDRMKKIPEEAHNAKLRLTADYYLGRCYERLRNYDMAQEYYESVIAQDIDSKYVRRAKKRFKELAAHNKP